MEKIKFEQESIRQQYEARVSQLKELAQSSQLTTRVLWDATVSKYAKTIDKVNTLLQQNELKEDVTQRLQQQIQAFLDKCAKPEFHIALVGAIKAGKSTLINAVLDEELASTEVTPETATLTKFRGSSETDCISITFYSRNEWDNLWRSASQVSDSKFMEEYKTLNAEQEKDQWVDHAPIHVECETREELKEKIQKWTSSRSAAHYFVKEAEVFLKDFTLPEGVILVDTPGLNDAVEYRSEITKNYIDRANAVFVCVKADKLSGPDLATIYGVFSNARYNPEKIYVIATQQDSLNCPVEDWKKQRAAWLGYLKEKACYGSQELAERNLISTSGYFYTLLKNQEHLEMNRKYQLYASAMKMQCMPDQIAQRYDEFLDFTGIAQLKRRMNTEIVEKYRELLREDILNSYEQLKANIAELIRKVRQRETEIIDASAKDLEDIKRVEAENREKLEEAQKDQKELEQLFNTIKSDATARKTQIAKAIRNLGGTRK